MWTVDNAVHLNSAMHGSKLLEFILHKFDHEQEVFFLKFICNMIQEVVVDGPNVITLKDIFENLGIKKENFTLDSLNVKVF